MTQPTIERHPRLRPWEPRTLDLAVTAVLAAAGAVAVAMMLLAHAAVELAVL